MFFRTKPFRRKDGSTRTYLELVSNHRVDGKVRQKVIARLGRLEQLRADGMVDCLEALRAEQDYAYGPVLTYRGLWEDLGLAQALQQAF